MKKGIAMFMALTVAAGLLVGCGSNSNSGSGEGSNSSSTAAEAASTPEANTEAKSESKGTNSTAAAEGPINVVSREDGSGTRGAFIELFGIEEKNDAGEKVDMTTEAAQITNNTSVMMTTVAGDTSSIGYISLGSLNDTVKAVKIDGAEASVDNVKAGEYKVTRPFNIVTKDGLSESAQDFVDYILSTEGQAVVEEAGYIPLDGTEAYSGKAGSDKVVVAGSSSVTPVMEKLAEAYKKLNPDANIEVQQSDSTTGVTSTVDGLCDIGMASRELKEEESSQGVTATEIATDGIAVIVNNDNPTEELTSDQVKDIFTGAVTDWSELQ